MENITVHHLCIQTDCYEETLAFYQALLSPAKIKEIRGFHSREFNTVLTSKTLNLEIQTAKEGLPFAEADSESCGVAHICFYSSDIEKTLIEVKAIACVSFLTKKGSVIYSVNGGRLFKIKAPEGTVIEFREKEEF